MNGTNETGEPQGSPFFCVALYPVAAYAPDVEPETPPQKILSVSAAQSPTATPSNRKKTLGAFGKPKHLRLKRPPTFAANAMPPESDQLAEHIAEDLGWKPKDWKPDAHQS